MSIKDSDSDSNANAATIVVWFDPNLLANYYQVRLLAAHRIDPPDLNYDYHYFDPEIANYKSTSCKSHSLNITPH